MIVFTHCRLLIFFIVPQCVSYIFFFFFFFNLKGHVFPLWPRLVSNSQQSFYLSFLSVRITSMKHHSELKFLNFNQPSLFLLHSHIWHLKEEAACNRAFFFFFFNSYWILPYSIEMQFLFLYFFLFY